MQSDDPSTAVPTAPISTSTAVGDADPAVEGEGSEHTSPPVRAVPLPPTTGDAVVDAATAELAEAESGSLAERIEAGERAHRVLRERLDDLSDRGAGGGAPGPGGR